jgi:hypothetical protein
MSKLEDEPIRLGRKARRTGKARETNPYRRTNDKGAYLQWDTGWFAEDCDIEAARIERLKHG